MADDHNTPFKARGQLGGRAATFEYRASEAILSYGFDDGEQGLLEKEDIIGIRGQAKSSNHKLFYIKQPVKETQEPGPRERVPDLEALDANGLPEAFVRSFSMLLQPEARSDRGQNVQPLPCIHIIVSTLSGSGNAVASFDKLLRPLLTQLDLREHDHYAVYYTESTQTITDLTAALLLPRANQGATQRIVLLSGDGGVVDVINALHGSRHTGSYIAPTISILPMGTGNALAYSYGVTRDRTVGLATLARGVAKQLPIFKARFSAGARVLVDEGRREEALAIYEMDSPVLYGGVVCSWGLHAGLVADSDTTEYRKFGVDRFKMAAKEALYPADGSEPHRYTAKVSLLKQDADGQERWIAIDRPDHAYVLATMVSNLEETFVISPASKPFDGRLRVVHFGHVDGGGFMRLMNLAYDGGKHVDDDFVSYEDVEGLRIEFQGLEKQPRWRRICVDGKIVLVEENGWVEVRKDKAKVVQLTSLT